MKTEPVVSVQFLESVKVKVRAVGFSRSDEHTFIDLRSKHKGLFEMVTTEYGVRVRATNQKGQVQTIPWSNVRCLTTTADETWDDDRAEAEAEAARAKQAAQTATA